MNKEQNEKFWGRGVARQNERRTESWMPQFTGTYTDMQGTKFWLDIWIDENSSWPIRMRTRRREDQTEGVPKGKEMEALAGLMGKDTGSPPTYVPGEDKGEEFSDDLPF